MLLLIAVLTLSQSPAPATCAVQGRVTDMSGAVLPGVTISVAGRAVAPAVTSEDGRYCVTSGLSGPQSLVFHIPGFRRVTVAVDLQTTPALRDVVLWPEFAQDVVVTATRTVRLMDTVPVRTEVIGSKAIAAASARTLADAVEYTTGIRVESNCQNCNFSQIRLLGLEGPYTQILVDGQAVISSLAQVYGIEQIPARMISRIEIVKGGGSALYGAGAVGGVVNIIPREGQKTSGLAELRFERGGSLNGALDWASGDRRTFVTSFAQRDHVAPHDVDGDGFTEVSRRDLLAAGTRAWRFYRDGRGKLTFDVSRLSESRRGGDQLDRLPHEALIAEAIESGRSSGSLSWYHGPGRYDYRVTVAGADTARDSYYGTGRDPNAYGDTSNRLFLGDAQVNHYLGRHIVSWGGQVSRDRTIDRQPAYGRLLDQTSTSRAVFGQGDWTIRKGWQVLSGVRVDWHSALSRPVVSPRLALMVSPSDAVDIRVSLARGFRAPQVFDEDLHLSSVGGEVRIIRIDPRLKEEKATNVMAGIEWKPVAGRGQALFEANVFHTRLIDIFHAIEQDDPATSAVEMLKTNLNGARVYGVELNVGWGIGDDFVMQGGVVAQRADFDVAEPDFGSREFFRTPKHYGNASVRWQGHSGWEVFAGVRATGRMKAPHHAGAIPVARLETTSRFTTMDLSFGRRITLGTGSLLVTLIGRNLTNAYQADLDRGPLRDAAYVYGPRFPRSFGLGARVEF